MTVPPEDPFATTPATTAPAAPPPAPGQYGAPPPPPAGYQPYPQAQYGPNPGTRNNWMGIVSLVASLSAIVLGFTCIVGIVFGHLGLNAVKKGEADNRGLALAGLITGYVFLGIGLLVVIAYIAFFAWVVSVDSSY